MKRYRKIAVGIMFATGTFGCITTIVRLRTVFNFNISIDPTWDYVPVTIWTELELAAGFVCVSLPSIRIFVVRMLPVRIKELLSSRSRASDRSDPIKKPVAPLPQRVWRKPATWTCVDTIQDADGDVKQVRQSKRFLTLPWTRDSGARLSSHMHSGSCKLNSAMSNYSESGGDTLDTNYKSAPLELWWITNPSSKALSLHSSRSRDSRDDHMTALPSIGCLPERSFSTLALQKDFTDKQ